VRCGDIKEIDSLANSAVCEQTISRQLSTFWKELWMAKRWYVLNTEVCWIRIMKNSCH